MMIKLQQLQSSKLLSFINLHHCYAPQASCSIACSGGIMFSPCLSRCLSRCPSVPTLAHPWVSCAGRGLATLTGCGLVVVVAIGQRLSLCRWVHSCANMDSPTGRWVNSHAKNVIVHRAGKSITLTCCGNIKWPWVVFTFLVHSRKCFCVLLWQNRFIITLSLILYFRNFTLETLVHKWYLHISK